MCRGQITDYVENQEGDDEYACKFEIEEEVCYQTVAEVVADVLMVIGDMMLFA